MPGDWADLCRKEATWAMSFGPWAAECPVHPGPAGAQRSLIGRHPGATGLTVARFGLPVGLEVDGRTDLPHRRARECPFDRLRFTAYDIPMRGLAVSR